MPKGIREFLRAKGGVGVLVSLYDEDRTFSEILDRVDVTSSTLTKRLEEALEEGLIDIGRTEYRGQRTNEYYLTELGYDITMDLSREGVVRAYRQMMTVKAQVDEGTDAVIEAIEKGRISFAMHPDRHQKTGREQFQEIYEARVENDNNSASGDGDGPESDGTQDSSEGDSETGGDDKSQLSGQLNIEEIIERNKLKTGDEDGDGD